MQKNEAEKSEKKSSSLLLERPVAAFAIPALFAYF